MFWFMFVLFFDVFCVSCFCLLFFLVILPVVLLFGGSVFDCFFFVCILFLLINFLCWSRCHTVSLWFDMIPKWSHWYHRNLIYGSVWFHYPKRYIPSITSGTICNGNYRQPSYHLWVCPKNGDAPNKNIQLSHGFLPDHPS